MPGMSDYAAGTAGKHFMQAAFMVDDIESAAFNWVRTTGVGPFFIVPHIELQEYQYRGEKNFGLHFSVAIAQSGGMQIELIQQHCDNPSAYRDLISKGRQGFHHLAIYCDDYDAVYQHYKDQEFTAAVEGLFGDMRFSYIDTSAKIGCMVELIEQNAMQEAFFQRIASAAHIWDGKTDPIRVAFGS